MILFLFSLIVRKLFNDKYDMQIMVENHLDAVMSRMGFVQKNEGTGSCMFSVQSTSILVNFMCIFVPRMKINLLFLLYINTKTFSLP